jgi:hypothetical protein
VDYLDTMTEKVSTPLSKNQLQQRERNARKARSRTLTKDQLKQKESNAREVREAHEARTGSCPFSEILYKKEQRTALKELSLQHASTMAQSMNGKLPLGFDNSLLIMWFPLGPEVNDVDANDWVKTWYLKCLSAPDNQFRLVAAQDYPEQFSETVYQEAMSQHI